MKKLYLILSLVLTLCLLCSCAEESLPEYIISNYDEESRLDLNDLINNSDREINSGTESSKDNSSDSELSDGGSSVSEPLYNESDNSKDDIRLVIQTII